MNDQHFSYEIGFEITNGLIDDEYLFFRALSNEFYGHQKFFVDIIRELSQYLGVPGKKKCILILGFWKCI
jgi:hypothetical protein